MDHPIISQQYSTIQAQTKRLIASLHSLADDLVDRDMDTQTVEQNMASIVKEEHVIKALHSLVNDQNDPNIAQQRLKNTRQAATTALKLNLAREYVDLIERLFTERNPDDELPIINPDGSYSSRTATQKHQQNTTEEFSVTAQKESLNCPITLTRFKDPVRSRRCGHTFERSAIQNLLVGNRNIGCPVSGCHHFVDTSMLETDGKMLRKLERLDRRRNKF